MTKEDFANKVEEQYKKNLLRYGMDQPVGTLILEMEDQTAKLRDAFLHRGADQVERRLINVCSLSYAILARG